MKTQTAMPNNTQAAMCRDTHCDNREKCYRYRAIPVALPRIQEYRKFKRTGEYCAGLIYFHDRQDIRGMDEINNSKRANT